MPTPSCWCYRCTRLVRVTDQNSVACPECNGGFVEVVETNALSPGANRRRFPAAAMYMLVSIERSDLRFRRRSRRSNDEWSPFNPVIVLHGGGEGREIDSDERGFELYYEDGADNGLRPLPEMMSELLIESGFDWLLEQLLAGLFSALSTIELENCR